MQAKEYIKNYGVTSNSAKELEERDIAVMRLFAAICSQTNEEERSTEELMRMADSV